MTTTLRRSPSRPHRTLLGPCRHRYPKSCGPRRQSNPEETKHPHRATILNSKHRPKPKDFRPKFHKIAEDPQFDYNSSSESNSQTESESEDAYYPTLPRAIHFISSDLHPPSDISDFSSREYWPLPAPNRPWNSPPSELHAKISAVNDIPGYTSPSPTPVVDQNPRACPLLFTAHELRIGGPSSGRPKAQTFHVQTQGLRKIIRERIRLQAETPSFTPHRPLTDIISGIARHRDPKFSFPPHDMSHIHRILTSSVGDHVLGSAPVQKWLHARLFPVSHKNQESLGLPWHPCQYSLFISPDTCIAANNHLEHPANPEWIRRASSLNRFDILQGSTTLPTSPTSPQ